ncbi:hypothetical protein J437_LFUL009158 [Ladona fulva]|uniref:Phospholipase n=1 Tax=Ladona fulva TaxID=123851 RepID=A0A8K0NYD4_LADFU|nr:hypothetical protein J437_LFUL009158 [Ladona fulva]
MSSTGRNGEGEDPEPTAPDSDYDEFLDIPYLDDVNEEPKPLDDKLVYDEPDCVVIPFQNIHKPTVKFKSPQRKVFIPGKEIEVKITDFERNVTVHFLNPNLYTIKFRHGDFEWTVTRRYKHFESLHRQLRIYRASLNVPFPTRSHRERRSSFRMEMRGNGEESITRKKGALPRFPSKPDALLPYEQIEHRMEQLEEYLRNLLRITVYRNHHATLYFMEVSHLSFVHGLGLKGKEGMVRKRTGSTQPGRAGCNFCGLLSQDVCVRCHHFGSHVCGSWRDRWLFIKDTFIGYIRPTDGSVKGVMLLDSGFEVSSGIYAAGMPNALQITNLSRHMIIRDWTKRKIREWATALREVTHSPAGREFVQKNRYDSFAPVRHGALCSWYVDGASYMEAVADALDAAREEIFIADWWLSPEIFMKRSSRDAHWQLHHILKRKAEQGVKVFVMLYKEVELALGINSYYSKQRLVTLHPENIKVLRHPDHAKAGVFLWAHHEKVVVVDQSIAFVGGLDLCYGRWDDPMHRLTDVGGQHKVYHPRLPKVNSSRQTTTINTSHAMLHLAQASNTVGVGVFGPSLEMLPVPVVSESDDTVDSSTVAANGLESEDRLAKENSLERMHSEIEVGPSPENIKCNTPELPRRSLANQVRLVTNIGKDWISRIYSGGEGEMEENKEKTDAPDSEEAAKEEEDMKPEGNGSVWRPARISFDHGDADNGAVKEDLITTDGDKVELIAPVDEDDAEDEVEEAPVVDGMARSLFTSTVRRPDEPDFSIVNKLWIGKDYTNFIVKDFSRLDLPYHDFIDRNVTPRMPWHDIGMMVQGAAARDVARHFIQRWNSIKLEKAQVNPMYPYLLPKSYENLEKVPYIPKDPLISGDCQVLRSVSHWSAGFLEPDMNEESIHLAYIDAINNAKHYIYIENQFFITLSGGKCSGQVKNQIGDTLLKRIMRAHRGKDAILTRLKENGINPEEYISFYGLRTHSVLHNDLAMCLLALVTELVYVHSKLMIVDDRVVICGSANINDRSMLGKRDSEIAVVIEVFKCIPSDSVRTFYKLKKYQEEVPLCQTDPAAAKLKLQDVKLLFIKDKEFEDSTMNGKSSLSGKFASSLRKSLFKEHLGIMEEDSTAVDDITSSEFYKDVWMATANKNTEIFEEVMIV